MIDDTPGAVFAESLAEIVSTSAGFDMRIEPASEEPEGEFFGLVGVMVLSGAMNGVLLVSANESDLKTAYSFITGKQSASASADDAHDTLCEFVNMTGGVAKSRMGRADEPFALSTPFVLKADGDSALTLIKKKRANMSVYRLQGSSPDGDPVLLVKMALLSL